MPAPFSILTLDLHNTIYDEALEYGLAIDEAVAAWRDVAPFLRRETLYVELAQAHRSLGSDWDDDAWTMLPSIKELSLSREMFNKVLLEAITRRREKSRELTLSGLYEGLRDTLTALKARGVRIHVVTEAAADAAMLAIHWLELEGIVDGVYSYPARGTLPITHGTRHASFPPGQNGHLRKPHPFLLAGVALDEAMASGDVPAKTTLGDVFEITHNRAWLLPEIPEDASVQQDITASLSLKKTRYRKPLKRALDAMLYVGDSKFRDGLLARNAGVAFGYAAYGKKGQDSVATRKSLEIMYAVTGWESEVLKLTQEAGRSETVNQLKPDYTFEDRLGEAMPLFI